jgi:hypothetical protein
MIMMARHPIVLCTDVITCRRELYYYLYIVLANPDCSPRPPVLYPQHCTPLRAWSQVGLNLNPLSSKAACVGLGKGAASPFCRAKVLY